MIMQIFLIFLAIGIFLKLQENQKKKESRVVTEEERNNFTKKLSNADIENQYFNMRAEILLKSRFPDMINWEWEKGGNETLHYLKTDNGVTITKMNGVQQFVLVSTKDVWGIDVLESPDKSETLSDETQDNDSKETTASEKNPVSDYLKEKGGKIEETVKAAIEAGGGFFAYFTVDEKLATEDFMQKLAQELERNTDYDVTFKENVLEIGFQNCL